MGLMWVVCAILLDMNASYGPCHPTISSLLGNVVILKKFLRTRKIMVMHSNERGEFVHVPS